MRVIVREMRKSVRKWLTVEKATVPQALALQSALEAGAIAGATYVGSRRQGEAKDLVEEIER